MGFFDKTEAGYAYKRYAYIKKTCKDTMNPLKLFVEKCQFFSQNN